MRRVIRFSVGGAVLFLLCVQGQLGAQVPQDTQRNVEFSGPAVTTDPGPPSQAEPEGQQDTARSTTLTAEPGWWTVIWVAVLCGGLGGVVFELLALQGAIEFPHWPDRNELVKLPHAKYTHVFDLGILARVIIGGLAAVVTLLVLSPTTLLRHIAISVGAGSAGVAVFRSIQERLLAALSQGKLESTAAAARNAEKKNEETMEALQNLTEKLQEAGIPIEDQGMAQGRARISPEIREDLNDLLFRLGSVQGALEVVRKSATSD